MSEKEVGPQVRSNQENVSITSFIQCIYELTIALNAEVSLASNFKVKTLSALTILTCEREVLGLAASGDKASHSTPKFLSEANFK